jgi:hypothetical protein
MHSPSVDQSIGATAAPVSVRRHEPYPTPLAHLHVGDRALAQYVLLWDESTLALRLGTFRSGGLM